MKKLIISASTLVTFIGISHSAVLIDNFESYSPGGPLYDTINGKGTWIVSNGNASDPFVAVVDDLLTGNRSASVGFNAPSAASDTVLYTALPLQVISPTAVPTSLSFDFAIYESSTGTRNGFQIYFKTDAAGSGNLLTIDLQPGAVGFYDVTYSSGYDSLGSFNGTFDTLYSDFVKLDIYDNGGLVEYNLSSFSGDLLGGPRTFALLPGSNITEFGIVWQGGNGLSDDLITIDNVYMVPEPSSALLLGLAGLGLMLRRRRA